MSRRRPLLAVALAGALLASLTACGGGSPGMPILANPVPAAPSVAPRTPPPMAVADPLPVVLPRDDGPHDRLTEWWYYTGHLRAADGTRYGFEFVIFRAERGRFPTSWVSHLAITDETGDRFLYSQRLEVGPRRRSLAARRRRRPVRVRPGDRGRRPVAPRDGRPAGLGDVRERRRGPTPRDSRP